MIGGEAGSADAAAAGADGEEVKVVVCGGGVGAVLGLGAEYCEGAAARGGREKGFGNWEREKGRARKRKRFGEEESVQRKRWRK